MIDLEHMKDEADAFRARDEYAAVADMLDAAAAELAAHRAASPLPSGPSVAERLAMYRAGALASGRYGAQGSEDMAHAMLAGEKDPAP